MPHIIILNIVAMLFQFDYHHFCLCIMVSLLHRPAGSPTLSQFGGFHLGRQPLWAVLQTGLACSAPEKPVESALWTALGGGGGGGGGLVFFCRPLLLAKKKK